MKLLEHQPNNQMNIPNPYSYPYPYPYPPQPQPFNYYHMQIYKNPQNEKPLPPNNNYNNNYQNQFPYGNQMSYAPPPP